MPVITAQDRAATEATAQESELIRGRACDIAARGDAPHKKELAELEQLIGGRRVKCVSVLAGQLQDRIAAGDTAAAGDLAELLRGGPAQSLVALAKRRLAMFAEFEQSAWAKRYSELRAAANAAAGAHAAAVADEDASPKKLSRLADRLNAGLIELSRHQNGRDDEMIAFRDALKPTQDPKCKPLDPRGLWIF